MVALYRARFSLLLTLLLAFQILPGQLYAAECVSKTCVDVYIENGQIVIEGQKGSGKKSTTSVKRKVVAALPKKKPVPKKLTRTLQVTTTRRSPVLAPPRKVSPVKVIPKKIVRKVLRQVAPALSLNDKLVKLLPTASIAKQPSENALVNVPVIFWCDLPSVFTTKVAVVGEIVDVAMRASFLWSFGDGTFFATTQPGRPYPDQGITHAYSHSGTYVVTMLATWGGTWSHNGVARAITGQIRKLSVITLSIENGLTRFTQ
ncbi:MAG: PKD domain-containing protein [Candidatus Nanopelagicaceae bacterium]|nr:PKD domain-containing protein [Candidatus Nanopelagicaceae bacterium]